MNILRAIGGLSAIHEDEKTATEGNSADGCKGADVSKETKTTQKYSYVENILERHERSVNKIKGRK